MNKCGISCDWLNRRILVVDIDGNVLPCCFFSHKFGRGDNKDDEADPVLEAYKEDEMNLNDRPLAEILDNPWWEQLYESWNDSDKISPKCVRYCSKGVKR